MPSFVSGMLSVRNTEMEDLPMNEKSIRAKNASCTPLTSKYFSKVTLPRELLPCGLMVSSDVIFYNDDAEMSEGGGDL